MDFVTSGCSDCPQRGSSDSGGGAQCCMGNWVALLDDVSCRKSKDKWSRYPEGDSYGID